MKDLKILTSLCFLLSAMALGAQEWTVPAEAEAATNPTEYSLDNVKAGKSLYVKNCKSCHGDPGKNNPLALVPQPVDIVTEKMQANSEGALYHKISEGRGTMPPFNTLAEHDRWMLVNFIMNFNPDREQLLVDAPPVKAKLLASVNEENKAVEIMAEYETEAGNYASLEETPVIVSSRKAFGNLEIGQVITGEGGRAEFLIPEDLTGDENGRVSIVVSLGEDYEAQEVFLDEAVVGKAKAVPQLIRKEVLWSTNNNVSTWLLLSYFLAAGGAWAGIIYVIVQIVKINKYGKSSEE